jgi:hypothetical protein
MLTPMLSTSWSSVRPSDDVVRVVCGGVTVALALGDEEADALGDEEVEALGEEADADADGLEEARAEVLAELGAEDVVADAEREADVLGEEEVAGEDEVSDAVLADALDVAVDPAVGRCSACFCRPRCRPRPCCAAAVECHDAANAGTTVGRQSAAARFGPPRHRDATPGDTEKDPRVAGSATRARR